MSGLPKLPGYNFVDPTLSRFHVSHTFDFINGYPIPRNGAPGIGGREVDINTVAYIYQEDPVRFDPSLTYGRTRSVTLPQFVPHYAMYDNKCLTFKAFFKQAVTESPWEFYRVRKVNIIYFLEDDTITVMEPQIRNSGLWQGRIVRRGPIPKTEMGDFWHWKDLAIGKDIALYGIVFHTVDCDVFTREYMRSQGLFMGDAEEMPPDLYTQQREMEHGANECKTPSADDKLRRYLEYDGKVLKFEAIWDTRDEEFGALGLYNILYFLADDTISVKEIQEKNSGKDPFPLLLKKTKLPKIWTDRPVDYPSCYLELSDAEVTEYYQPIDLQIGETIFVLGRRMLLVDCDPFTRNYYRKALCTEQKPAIQYKPKPKPPVPRKMPPHDGIGTLEDSLQNTLTFMPKTPRKDVVRQLLNAGKSLRYVMKFDVIHPEDSIRKFTLTYNLSEGTCYIYEPPIRNSGIWGGKYLRDSLVTKPGSDPLNPDYYTPADFYIGATIIVHHQRFIITDADLYVYRYMQANPEKFPLEVVENIRNYMYNNGHLTDDVKSEQEKEAQAAKKAHRDAIGKELEVTEDKLATCMEELKAGGGDPVYEKTKMQEILNQYEESLKPTFVVPEHGIQPVNLECRYPIKIGTLPDLTCKEDEIGPGGFTPKHVDTPEEIKQKYYAKVLQEHHDICERGKPVVCDKPTILTRLPPDERYDEPFEPIMVSGVQHPKGACRVKAVKFTEEDEKCLRDRYDLCDLKKDKIPCDCTQYQQDQCK